MQINRSAPVSPPQSAPQSSQGKSSFNAAAEAGINPVSIAGGNLLEETHQLMQSMREAIAAADQGMRGLQVR